MNHRFVCNIIGKVLLAEALLMIAPLTVSLVSRESVFPYVFTMLPLFLLGGGLSLIRPAKTELFAREGFVCVSLSWILMSLFGALPFVLSGDIPSYTDALFETVSGLTTTGASILDNPEKMSRAGMFWRLFSHWIGGMGVLVFIAAVLPVSGDHYMQIMKAEVPGPTVSKLVPQVKKTARILYSIYLALTALEFVFLLLGGMSFYDAILHAFATAGTGGFSTRASSIAAYDSLYLEMVIASFMLLFGCNFNIFYLLLLKQFRPVFRSEELRVYLGIVLVSVLLIAWNILPQVKGFAQGLRYAYFQVMTVMSTSGFATADFDLWPAFSRWILVLLMFGGGCAGSTAGGMKLSRIIILCKSLFYELRQQIVPSRVKRIWFEGKPVSEQTVKSVLIFFFSYMAIAGMVVFLLSLDCQDLLTNLTASVACMSNIGPGLNAVGPTANYGFYSAPSKLLLCVEMLMGRLEIFPLMFLLSPNVWKKH